MNDKRKKYRPGTIVYIKNEQVLNRSFNVWPKDKLFIVTSDGVINGKRYVWINNYSIGIEPKEIRMATEKQKKQRRVAKAKNKAFKIRFFMSIKDIKNAGLEYLLRKGRMIFAANGMSRGKYDGVKTIHDHMFHVGLNKKEQFIILSEKTDGIFLVHEFTKDDIRNKLRT